MSSVVVRHINETNPSFIEIALCCSLGDFTVNRVLVDATVVVFNVEKPSEPISMFVRQSTTKCTLSLRVLDSNTIGVVYCERHPIFVRKRCAKPPPPTNKSPRVLPGRVFSRPVLYVYYLVTLPVVTCRSFDRSEDKIFFFFF